MKLIVTHKKQLRRSSDLKRFLAYIYGPKGDRPVVPVESYLPGLATGDPNLDAESLLSHHHGGKAAKARSVVLSSNYFNDRDTAMLHAPAMAKSAAAFRLAWAAEADAVSVVHLTRGKNGFAGMWRLDCHLIISNSDGTRGIQWSREQCSKMQDMDWIPNSVKEQFEIRPGKGAGITRRTEKIPYPKTDNLIAYEIGELTTHQIETGLSNGLYGAARRAKDGRIISIESEGKRINIARARHLIAVRNGAEGDVGIMPSGRIGTPGMHERLAPIGINPEATFSMRSQGFADELGSGVERGRSPASNLIQQRRRRLSGRRAGSIEHEDSTFSLGAVFRKSESSPVADNREARALLKQANQTVLSLSKSLGSLENVEIFRS